jgi:ribosomal protein L29
MPLPKAKELRKKTDEELAKDIDNYNRELITLPDTKYGRKQSIKKLIARTETIMTERRKGKKVKKPVIDRVAERVKIYTAKVAAPEKTAKKADKPAAKAEKQVSKTAKPAKKAVRK